MAMRANTDEIGTKSFGLLADRRRGITAFQHHNFAVEAACRCLLRDKCSKFCGQFLGKFHVIFLRPPLALVKRY